MNISVLMAVYSGESEVNLRTCLQSLEEQTLRADEVILVQDGPISDELSNTIKEFTEILKINLIKINTNTGLANALNVGLLHCNGEFIARMDSDDRCHPQRFEIQYNFMMENPDISLTGSYVSEFTSDMSVQIGIKKVPQANDMIVAKAKFINPINHPTVFASKAFFTSVGEYLKIYPEDYLLWIRAMRLGHKFANIPLVLVDMRSGGEQTLRRGFRFLKGEIRTFNEMLRFDQITYTEYLVAIIPRILVRLTPAIIRKHLIFFAKRQLHYR